MNLPDTNKYIPIFYIVGLLVILLIIYRVLRSIGIIKSKAKTREKEMQTALITDLRGVQQFDVLYLENRKDYKTLSAKAQTYAEDLRKALRGFGTDEEAVFSTFARLDSKDNISEIALVYRNKYERDLLTDLLNDLTKKEKAQLMTIINKLP